MRVSFSPAPAEPPTTKKELWAWYSYAFASEAYVVVALTSFIPITLEALASEEGHLYGTNEPCIARPNITGITGITALNTGTNAQVMERPRCMISFGHLEVDTASFVMYLTSLAVFLQALTVVSISSMADYGSYRKKQLIAFSAIGATATMLIGAVPYVWMAGALSVIANVSFGAGIVCFNAYLPLLVRNVERLRRRREQLLQLETEVEVQSGHPIQSLAADVSNDMSEMAGAGHVHGTDDARATLLHDQEQPDAAIPEIPETAQTLEQKRWLVMEMSEQLNEDKGHLMGQISAKGFASGYLGGILLLLACLYISYRDKSSTRSLKVGIFLSGLWWFLFAALAGVWLKQRPGRELRLEDRSQKHGSLWVASRYVLYSWSRVGATIVQARKLPSAFAFLISWFFLSDGYTSIANVALLFAKTSLQMPQTQLILLSLEVPICALVGTLAFPKLQRVLGYNQKQMVLLLLIMLVMVPVYGTLGLILSFWPHLSSAKELFAVAAYFGFLIGAVQSFCRSMFADLVPRGRESEFFGLYAITDKGSSWLGPLAVAAITDATHEIRYAFVFLLVLLSLPIPIIYFGVDMNQGRLDAEKASQELQQIQTAGEHGEQDRGEESERLLSSV
ncbi:autophagy-related protein 22-like protein [Gamsiella multidivaricata]|uniref:autophagy-related protein 22-like protein n=1 Tax=Gamsiella multidivaricata TaxID=101098 RepID=UPI002220EF87|nr:autophagy-related protein 22-like protein [Gamsiella multidivaricata]KAI7818052.1 autophagy-related protein 22-like protein [Gamsiella multidivaricata]